MCFSLLPPEDPLTCPKELLEEYPKELHESLQSNWNSIRTHYHRNRKVINLYILRFDEKVSTASFIKAIFHIEKTFKINFAFSFILQNVVTGELRIFYASRNTEMFTLPPLVTNMTSLNELIDKVVGITPEEIIINSNVSVESSWVIYDIFGILATVYKL